MRLAALLLLFSATAAAQSDFPNDVQLFRLGHPEALTSDSTKGAPCPGSTTQICYPTEPGDPTAQTRFAQLAAELGLAAIPRILAPAESLGDAGFELSASFDLAFVNGNEVRTRSDGTVARDGPTIWVTEGATPPNVLLIPTLRMRKGLPFSAEVGLDIGYILFTQAIPATLSFKIAALEGFKFVPDVAVRGFATHVIGERDLDLTMGGLDVSVSKSFGIAGMFNITPYLGWNSVWMHASSGPVDFKPTAEIPALPSDDDSVFYEVNFGTARFDRFFGGLRLVSYVLVVTLGADYSFASGIYDGTPAGAGGRFEVGQLGVSGKLGVDF
jgi:hypothetical protein